MFTAEQIALFTPEQRMLYGIYLKTGSSAGSNVNYFSIGGVFNIPTLTYSKAELIPQNPSGEVIINGSNFVDPTFPITIFDLSTNSNPSVNIEVTSGLFFLILHSKV